MQSSNFELVSTASEGKARDTLREFERVSNFFEQALQRPVKPDVPLRIVLLRDEKEFQQYRPGEGTAAYYAPGPDRDYIVMFPAGDQNTRVAIHEFVHLLVKHSGAKDWPVWLNEGVAELYSTMRPIGNKVQVGGLIEGHMIAFRTEKPIPLREMLAADHNSPLYNKKRHAGMFYAQSWALTHMLQLQPDYRASFTKIVELITEKQDSATAIEAALARPLVRVQKDLDAYMRGDSFMGVNFDIKMSNKVDVALDPPTPTDITVTKAAMLAIGHQLDDAAKLLDTEIAKTPKDPALHVAKGFLHYRTAKFDLARESFKEAYVLGTDNTRVLQDLAKMSMRDDPETATGALQRVIQGGNNTLDLKLMLADAYLRQKKYGAAHAAVAAVTKVTKEDAYRLFRIRAQAEDGLNQPGALETAKRAQQYAPDDNRDFIDRYVKYLEQKKEFAARREAYEQQRQQRQQAAPPTDDGDRPVLARATPARPSFDQQPTAEEAMRHRSPEGKQLLKAEGKFTELVCRGDQAVVVMRLGVQSYMRLVILDPNKLISSDAGESKALDFTCGPQKGRNVVAWFDDAPHKATNSAGVLWELHLQP
ncbi:hypothetical protein F183_A00770 [Bryobacterales bacterium F-183]|nr:hypothetical protein F183_A00770 [Bryobacterales bacterium F-183]